MSARWTDQRERGHPALLRAFVRLALIVGRPFARLLLHPIVLYFVLAGGDARAASRDYLQRVLGRQPRFADGYRHVHAFASVLLDRMFLLNGRRRGFRIRVVGDSAIRSAKIGTRGPDGSMRRGAFMIGAHLGSFEAVLAGGPREDALRVSMVMYEDNAQEFAALAASINPRMASMIIPLGRVDSMLRVKRALDDGGFVGMLADRTLAEEQGTAAVRAVKLLGDTVYVPVGPFRMAAMLRRPAIFIVGLYRGGRRYEVHYEELEDFARLDFAAPGGRADALARAIDRAIERYVQRLEYYCRRAPNNWFNFYDYWDDGQREGTYCAQRRAEEDKNK
jgi:predicted LPLAT superfamily acyltransferase